MFVTRTAEIPQEVTRTGSGVHGDGGSASPGESGEALPGDVPVSVAEIVSWLPSF
ncbi:hypothetical protein [Microbacterium paraoxydans]|uniref:hypothetical protein n=1 Tax=Microbacterium paraoxydans TaxID=199592 RepID=UPI001CFC457F|nr:hypothetical protein [Microbacterium paraoxydans]